MPVSALAMSALKLAMSQDLTPRSTVFLSVFAPVCVALALETYLRTPRCSVSARRASFTFPSCRELHAHHPAFSNGCGDLVENGSPGDSLAVLSCL
jgi:hypothetical protein